jgi:1,4-dihydroxy-2-naphthoyl-CoA hydrolase
MLAITTDVIAGLDPAIHHLKNISLEDGWIRGSSPRMTSRTNTGEFMTLLEKIQSMKMPFAELKGVMFVEADKDRVVARMLVRPELCTLRNTIHGGAVMALADSVGAAATVINLPEDAKGTTTIESKTNFIGGAKEGSTVIATATPVHRGRRTQVWQTRLETEDGKLVAVVTQTQMVL